MPKAGRPGPPPELQPLEIDERPLIWLGIALWVVAFVLMTTVFRDDLRRHHTEWWLISCGVGVALGLYGLHFTAKRHRAIAREREGQE
jgi:membrane protein DedA with SNARE-associated domain